MDSDNVNYEVYVITLIRMTETRKTLALFTGIRCASVVVGRAIVPGIAARLIPGVWSRARAKARTARVALSTRPRAAPRTPSFASTAIRRDTLRRSAGRRNVRRTVTCQRTKLTNDACNVDCMGFDMASLEVEEAVAPHTKRWQTVKPRGSYSHRVMYVPLRNHPRDHQSFNRYSPLMSQFALLLHAIRSKRRVKMEAWWLRRWRSSSRRKEEHGKITIDWGAAENVLPGNYLLEIPLHPSPGSQRGACFIAANGTRMERCFLAQPILSALQRHNRRKCAHLAASADLPPHHRWSEREDNDIHIFDVLPLAATLYIQIRLKSALYPDPDRFPDPQATRLPTG